MTRALYTILALHLVVGCVEQESILDPNVSESPSNLINVLGTPRAPCVRSSGNCVDMYVVAHEDDDMLFMNPDIQNSISRGNKVVVVFMTSGNLDGDGQWSSTQIEAYWKAREYGVLDAYKNMANPANSWTGVDYLIPGTSRRVVKYTRPSPVAGAPEVTLIFFRLEDNAVGDLWRDGGTKTPLTCSPCPSDADGTSPPGLTVGLAAPVAPVVGSYTKEQLIDTVHRLMTAVGATSVSTLDATHAYFPLYGLPTSEGQIEYPEHYYVARNTLSAAVRYQRDSAAPVALRFYRGYSLNQEASNLAPAEATAKKRIFAFYFRWDVKDGTQTTTNRKASGLFSGTPNSSPVFNDGDYDVRWPLRNFSTRSLVGTGELRGRISVKTSFGTGCLTVISSVVQVTSNCDTATTWILSATNRLQSASTGLCLEASSSGSLSMASCTATPTPGAPIPEGRVFFMLGNGQIIGRDGKCLTGDPSTTLVTFGECTARCIDQVTGVTATCPTADPFDPEAPQNPGAAGPLLTQEWTLLFTPVGLLSGTQSQFNYATGISSFPIYWNTFSLVDQNFCVRRADGVHCVAANGFSLGAVTVMGNFTDAQGWTNQENGSTVRGAFKSGSTTDSTTVACGRGYWGVSCTNGEMAWDFSTPQGWDYAQYYYGSVRYADVNADGLVDVCGRGGNGINCAIKAPSGFYPMRLWGNETFTDAAGWNANGFGDSIQFGDVNGDGKPDVCGRGRYSVECLYQWQNSAFLNRHDASFDADRRGDTDSNPATTNNVAGEWSNDDPITSWGSSSAYYGSMRLVDINKDGFADLCSRGPGGIYCAFSYGNAFGPRKLVVPFEFTDAQGWWDPAYGSAVTFGDVDADNRVDVCARGYWGVSCAEGY